MPTYLPPHANQPAAEFRRYRRFVTWAVLLFISLGSTYLLASVGVSIYRRGHAIPTGDLVSTPLTANEMLGCWEELSDVMHALEKHLENFHTLLSGYNQNEAQRWADEGAVWRSQANLLGKRCRFGEAHAAGTLAKPMEEMAAAHEDLRETEKIYGRALLRFGKNEGPRLDRVRKRVETIGDRLRNGAGTGTQSGDNKT